MISINIKIFHIFLLAGLISGIFFALNYYQTVNPVVVEFKLQLFIPPGMENAYSKLGTAQVAQEELVLPAAGAYDVVLIGNCTLYVQTDDKLLKNPRTLTVTNRGIRIIILNQTTDVTVKFIPQQRIDKIPAILLLLGGVVGYAVRVFKFE
ncbi:MAG: hypothetical protein J7K48_04840 [Thermococcus sp.]|nr:hypothetical protein [Thermococcus sp.]